MADGAALHTLHVARDGTDHVVTATGELDLTNVADLRTAIVTTGNGIRRVVVDLSAVSFLDSSALNSLISGRDTLAGHGVATLVVAPASQSVRRVLEITKLGDLISVVETRDGA